MQGCSNQEMFTLFWFSGAVRDHFSFGGMQEIRAGSRWAKNVRIPGGCQQSYLRCRESRRQQYVAGDFWPGRQGPLILR
jgi:hypothetical protein